MNQLFYLLSQDNRPIFKTFAWRENALRKLIGKRLIDVLLHLPTGILVRQKTTHVDDSLVGKHVTIPICIHEHIKGRPYRIIGECGDEPIELDFFTPKSFLIRKAAVGSALEVTGKLEHTKSQKYARYCIVHPEKMEPLRPQSLADNNVVYETLYPLTAGVTHTMIRSVVQKALGAITGEQVPDWVPNETKQHYQWPMWLDALKNAHQPKTENDLTPFSPSRARLIYDEFLAYQLGMLTGFVKAEKPKAPAFKGMSLLQKQLLDSLPFQLTQGQQDALSQLNQDMEKPEQMLRLMQGDVGSGKTIVAVLAALKAIEHGYQAAILVPTDILSRQHFYGIEKYLKPLGLSVAILTGRETGKKRQQILADLKDGLIHMLVGTHALIEDTVQFHRLGFVVIDEQHRFGVEQRAKLSEKGENPHILAMTATPIPRTLSLTQYGDMDITTIREKPACRIPTETCVMSVKKMDQIVESLKRVMEKGEKIFWVCPLIEESETMPFTAAIERYNFLNNAFLNQVALVHGRLSSVDKEAAMNEFVNGDKNILVATTVIEVGVDVPAASVIVIEHAERFGLAQLHQLRGRIGRGDQPSTCILLYGTLTPFAQRRLTAMKETHDGFIIAEADLKLRGRGEVLGTKQSGMPKFRFCQFDGDNEVEYDYLAQLLAQAHQDAKAILAKDPTLSLPVYQALLSLFKIDEGIRLKQAG